MIPFSSQRGLGQDLATHLLNSYDNELVELAELRGAIASDIHGAFAEWEAQAHALTRCKNYLYSLSVNPDPKQAPLSREQYFNYINRVEEKLGLTDQPRAVVFHSKYGREHCHVAWSRINPDQEKAVQLSFDREKLMMVTREFAHDHSIELPAGYFKGRDGKDNQISLYEMHQERTTGLSKEQHQDLVTDAWRMSDSPKAFMQALAEKGYILATGKRPYVLVDYYGNTHALPRLINDKTVRTKDIRNLLGKDFPVESLPGVDEAKEQVAQHRLALEDHFKSEQHDKAVIELQSNQSDRRKGIVNKQASLKQKQHQERNMLALKHRVDRDSHRAAFLLKSRQVKRERNDRRSVGLAAFLGRASGVGLVRKYVHKVQDKKRHGAFREDKGRVNQEQEQQKKELKARHKLQTLELVRKLKFLGRVDKRELRSLEEGLRKEARISQRDGRDPMPSLMLEKGDQRTQVPSLEDEFTKTVLGKQEPKNIELTEEFTKAASGRQTEREDQESGEMVKSSSKTKVRRYGRKRKCDKDLDRGR